MSEKKYISAFPVPFENEEVGITIRDYFAIHALSGLLASYAGIEFPSFEAPLAKRAYEFADAMLKERAK